MKMIEIRWFTLKKNKNWQKLSKKVNFVGFERFRLKKKITKVCKISEFCVKSGDSPWTVLFEWICIKSLESVRARASCFARKGAAMPPKDFILPAKAGTEARRPNDSQTIVQTIVSPGARCPNDSPNDSQEGTTACHLPIANDSQTIVKAGAGARRPNDSQRRNKVPKR